MNDKIHMNFENIYTEEPCNICGGEMEIEPGTEEQINFLIYTNLICKDCLSIESRVIKKVTTINFLSANK